MKNCLTVVAICLVFLNVTKLIAQQFTEMTSISLTAVSQGSVAWGDYDNDNDLDILLTGSGVAKIYRNDGSNTFTEQSSIVLTGVMQCSVAWGDYDNDGDLDILLTGNSALYPSVIPVSNIYRNDGNNTFTEQTSISLIDVWSSSVAWGDYDNDGDLDILLTGDSGTYNDAMHVSTIYRNNGNNAFSEQTSIVLKAVSQSSVAWGDYDNDGDLDILLTGSCESTIGRALNIYRNNGDNTYTELMPITSSEVSNSSVAWGDYDNDGDLDILLSGYAFMAPISRIFRNDGDNTFTQISASLSGVGASSAAWGDYDNDGDLDILLTGRYSETERISKIYRNDGGDTFTEQTSISLTNVDVSSVAWGDYDNDGDLDILLTGASGQYPNIIPVTKIYRNNNATTNTVPTIPSNLTSSTDSTEVTLNWDKSIDNETTQNGLRYNLVIGSTQSGVDILSPMSNRQTGYRNVINLGNTNHNNSWTIKDLEDGTYYWSVQALDNNFAGSDFAEEKIFTITLSNLDDKITSKIPSEFKLYQNFPNPFNPLTRIRYSLPELSFVIIKVYDVLGNEITTLVNEERPIGNYEVEFDATELPSGIYFYKIQAGDFIQTKKMILMK